MSRGDMSNSRTDYVPAAAQAFLIDHGLAAPNDRPIWTPLTGGVSSDLWRVDIGDRSICVKGALPTLRVAGEWHAPTSRNTVEWNWLNFAAGVAAANVPRPLAHDPDRGLFAMTNLPAEDHPVWKAQLLSGVVDTASAAAVGDLIGRLHAYSTTQPDLVEEFATDENFESLRIQPYLRTLRVRNSDLADPIDDVIDRTASTHRVVVHGDVSPKNILIGPTGPVLLDAECAWYGDPAFDLAFVLNHLFLKMLVVPDQTGALGDAASALTAAYLRHVTWEPVVDVTAR
ncbi:aminoglycoside phosphotransferase family protein, partial [Mycolicibacterium fortuitum]